MTSEEIKSSMTMRDVLTKYGIRVNRSGMASCPFHGTDNHPSMRVYKDGYNCFTCHANGDIFKFVMEYEGVSFSDAFKILGGTYKHENPTERRVRIIKTQIVKKEREASERKNKEFEQTISRTLSGLRAAVKIYEPFTDEWVQAINDLTTIEGIYEEKYINRGEVNELDVYRKCKRINERIGIG